MKLAKYLDIKVAPRSSTISLSEKYPESTFVFEYEDGESARIDSFDDCTAKGEQTLLQNLTGADEPSEDETVESFNGNLIDTDDLLIIQLENKNIKRVWVFEH